MQNTSRLYDTLLRLLRQPKHWLDQRHLYTLVWMVVGLLHSGRISLTSWVPYVRSRAQYAQSTQRRFHRWFSNERIDVHALYGPLLQQALTEWGGHVLYVALDTSQLEDGYCLIRLSLIFRGRAIPIVWRVLKHASATVCFQAYQPLLEATSKLLPRGVKVVLLADRGFADTSLMRYAKQLGWHYRIRIKCSFIVWRHGKRYKVEHIGLRPGQAMFLERVSLTDACFGPVSLALAVHSSNGERWYVVSDEPVTQETFTEYGFRFDIEENFLDDKSNGFQLEDTQLDSAEELERLCMVLAVATLYLVCQGVEVVQAGKRRMVDPHWFRGSSYLKIGWNWIRSALSRGWRLCHQFHLPGEPDPEPARASREQVGAFDAFVVIDWDTVT